MAKIVHFIKPKKEDFDNSPPADKEAAGEGKVVYLGNFSKYEIPSGYKLEIQQQAVAESEEFICDCCGNPYATFELWWMQWQRFYDPETYISRCAFAHLIPPIMVRSCTRCLPKAKGLANRRLRIEHLGYEWLP